MKLLILAASFLLILSCTHKAETKSEAPAVAASKKVFRNRCEELIDGTETGLPVSRALLVQMVPILVCEVHFQSGNKIAQALYFEENGKLTRILGTDPEDSAECGTSNRELKAEVIQIKVEGATHPALAIEDARNENGCCGAPTKVKSKILIYDLSAHKMSSEMEASDYCIADQECSGRCHAGDKKPLDSGTELKFDWVRCEGGEPCEKILFRKVDHEKNTKPLEFLLKWNKDFKLTSAAY